MISHGLNVGLDLSQGLGLGLDQGLVPVWFGLVFDSILCLGLGLSLVLDLRLRPRQSMSLGLETYSVCVWLFFLSSVEFSYSFPDCLYVVFRN